MPFEQVDRSSTESIALLKQRLSGFETEEGRLSGLSYKPKSKDEVIITTTPKAGEWTALPDTDCAHPGVDTRLDLDNDQLISFCFDLLRRRVCDRDYCLWIVFGTMLCC